LQTQENRGILRDFSIGDKKHKNDKRLSVVFLCFSVAHRKRAMFTCTIEIFGHLISPLCVLCASVFLKFKKQRHREHGELMTEKVNTALLGMINPHRK
jgi:hypothetical protein